MSLSLHSHLWSPAASPGGATLLLLHGTGGDEHDLLPLAGMVAPGVATLSVRGNVLENGAPRFFRRLAEGVFDLEDLARRTQDLAIFLDAAAAEDGFEASRLYALGFSNGANVAASLMLTSPASLAGGVLLRAMVPFEPAALPDLSGRSILMSQGQADPIVPRANGERLAELLRSAGADVELAWQPTGHQLARGDVDTAARWLAPRVR